MAEFFEQADVDAVVKDIKRYMVHPGWCLGPEGRFNRFLTFDDLVRLYGVERGQCVNATSDRWFVGRGGGPFPQLVHLHPQPDGDYSLPGEL